MTDTLAETALAFRANPRAFASTIGWVAKYVPNRPALPVIGGILMEVDDGVLTVSGFDYDTTAQACIDVDGAAPGRALVSGRLLAELVKTFPDKPVDVAVGDTMTVKCGTVKVTLPLMIVDDYPAVPAMPPTIGTVNGIDFAALIGRVGPAADHGSDTGRKALHGVYLAMASGEIEAMASDGKRAAVGRIPWHAAVDDAVEVTVPAGALLDAGKALDGPDALTIGYSTAAGVLGVASPTRRIVTRLLAEEFPVLQLRQIVPSRADTPAAVPAGGLTVALKRAAMVGTALTPVQLAFTGDVLTVSGDGDAKTGETLDCSYAGDDITIHVNPHYLAEGLAGLRSDAAEISITHPHKPFVLTAPDDADQAYRHAIVPIRVR